MSAHPYDRLTPDTMLDAVESFGVRCDGSFLALNSYENRVYQIGIEDDEPLVVKFYRPGRWSRAAILEEHEFTLQLSDLEIPVVAPLRDAHGHTLFDFEGFQFAVFPRRGGRAPELDRSEVREWIGRFLGRIHAVGRVGRFSHRPVLNIESYVLGGLDFLRTNSIVPDDVSASYFLAAEEALALAGETFERFGPLAMIRIHGDCHPSNILWTDNGPHFVDLDDCRSGPAVQDLWMMLSGEREERTRQLADFLKGYSQFADFDAPELMLIEALRTMRMLYYSGWLAQRWDDPAFPKNFPWFESPRYWEDQIQTLREQYELLQEPALEWKG